MPPPQADVGSMVARKKPAVSPVGRIADELTHTAQRWDVAFNQAAVDADSGYILTAGADSFDPVDLRPKHPPSGGRPHRGHR